MIRTLSLLVENRSGVMSRIATLFSGKSYNLESMTVGATIDPSISRMTLVSKNNDILFEQIKKQIERLVDVISVEDLTHVPAIRKEFSLIKVTLSPKERDEICHAAEMFESKVVDVGQDTIIIEINGLPKKIDEFISLLEPYNIVEIARSGLLAMKKCDKTRGSVAKNLKK